MFEKLMNKLGWVRERRSVHPIMTSLDGDPSASVQEVMRNRVENLSQAIRSAQQSNRHRLTEFNNREEEIRAMIEARKQFQAWLNASDA